MSAPLDLDAIKRHEQLSDAAFIAHAREDVPALLLALQEAQDANAKLRAAIQDIVDHYCARPARLRLSIVNAAAVLGGEDAT